MDTDPAARGALDRVLAAAAEVLRLHIPDAHRWCLGCLDTWQRLTPFPCEQAKWANAIIATYRAGAHEDAPPPSTHNEE